MTSVVASPVALSSVPGAVVDWLLDAAFPTVRRLALVRVLGRSTDDPEVLDLEERLADDPWVATMLSGQWREGAKGRVRVHPYKKWGGAHWRLVTLAEMGVSVRTPGARGPIEEAFAEVAAWLLAPQHVRRVPPIDGRFRRCGSQEGNALWAACRLGIDEVDEIEELAANLLRWQWPDGGWNCDVRPTARHSSFNESWAPLRGLVAYRDRSLREGGRDGPDAAALDSAINRGAEFFLRHRVVESERTGELAHPTLALLRWPPYWHYGLLPGLRALQEAGCLADARVRPALDRLRVARAHDGTWRPDGRWWARPSREGANVEIVDWGPEGEARMLTLQALEVLGAVKAA